jgi:hypothetical protein
MGVVKLDKEEQQPVEDLEARKKHTGRLPGATFRKDSRVNYACYRFRLK